MKKEQCTEISFAELHKMEKIPFAVYLWMPKNNKLIRLCNAGDLFKDTLLIKYQNLPVTFFKDPASEIIEVKEPNAEASNDLSLESPQKPEDIIDKPILKDKNVPNEVDLLSTSNALPSIEAPIEIPHEPAPELTVTSIAAQNGTEEDGKLIFSPDESKEEDITKIAAHSDTEVEQEARFSSGNEETKVEEVKILGSEKTEDPALEAIRVEGEETDNALADETLRFRTEVDATDDAPELAITRIGSSKVVAANFLSIQLAYSMGYTNQQTLTSFSKNSMKYFDEISDKKISTDETHFPLLTAIKSGEVEQSKTIADFRDVLTFLEEYFEDSKSSDKEKEIVEVALDRTLDKLNDQSKLADPMNLVRWKGMLSKPLSMDSYSFCNRSAILAQKELRAS